MRHGVVLTALALILGACSSTGTEPPVKTITVDVPVAVKCAVATPAEPAYPDTDQALADAADIFAGVQLLKEGRALRIAYIQGLQATLKGCTG
jgi:hypothetical protein